MTHTLERHTHCVNELCCICGNISITKKKKKNNNRYLQGNVYTDITITILTQTQSLTNNKNVIERAVKIQPSLKDLNSAFSTVHCAISHTEPIEPSSVTKMEAEIDKNMSTYRKMFPFKTIPKQHILEKHCSPHTQKKKRVALGLMGEKGTENSHQMISSIERDRAQGMRNGVGKLNHILTAHLLQVAPSLRN